MVGWRTAALAHFAETAAMRAAVSIEALRKQLDARRAEFAKRSTTEPRFTTQHSTNGVRECERRRRQGAHLRQLDSHRDLYVHGVLVGGKFSPVQCRYETVKPRHIFGWGREP